jgi:hypothetical protein
MTKRNLILLIIILAILMISVFGFMYFNQGVTPAKVISEGTNFISTFNPLGGSKTQNPITNTPATNDNNIQNQPQTPATEIMLKKVSSVPVAGFTVYTKERLKDVVIEPVAIPTEETPKTKTTKKPTPPLTEFMPALRYVDRVTGNIYETFADKIEERKFSTTIIPKIYEAFFGNKGESVVMRYLNGDNKTIETFTSNLPREYLGADTNIGEIKGIFLTKDIKDVSLSPDTTNIFYLFNTGNNMVGSTFNLLSGSKTQVFVSPFTEWLPSWPNTKTITLTTKPAFGIPGYMYALDLSTKSLNRVFGNINGLTTLTAPSGKLVLYSNDNLSLSIYHTDTKVSDLLAVKTLPEKCVWGKNNDFIYCAVPQSAGVSRYPDAWYQGEVSFSDQLWKIDVKTGNATILVDPITVSGGEEIDGIKLELSPDENYLFFVNKKDSYLWELKIN